MKFTQHPGDLFESDAGFSVKVERSYFPALSYIYQENGRTLKVGGERLVTPHGVTINPKLKAKWDSPHDHEAISVAEFAQILLNIKAAFDFQNEPVAFGKPITKADLEFFRLLEPTKTHRTFSIPKPTLCECSEGFSIEFNGHSLSPMLYQTGGKGMSFHCSNTQNRVQYSRVNAKAQWDPPHQAELIDLDEIWPIEINVLSAIAYMKSEGFWPPPTLGKGD